MHFDQTLCCGCAACLNICPANAISWTVNAEGFFEPKIDDGLCIECGLCRKVCPYETNHVGNDADPQIYAAVHRDEQVVLHSSSGGMLTALSDVIFSQNGIVYGVAFDEALSLVYIRTTMPEQRDALRGSKYVQCDGKEVFTLVEQDLRSGQTVMFTGTPCQVSGLKLYLEAKRVPTERLYLVDNICHGAASPRVWNEYLSYIREEVLKGSHIEHLSMRSKRVAWQQQFLDCQTEQGDESDVINATASWNKLYLTTYATRPSCYQCRYTSYERVGDITCADYWNIENAGVDIDYSNGVNLVLINTRKGEDLFEAASHALIYNPSDKKACWQIHLERPNDASGKRRAFWSDFNDDPRGAVRKYGKGSRFTSFTRVLSPILRKVGLYELAVRTLSLIRRIKGGHAK